MEQNALSSTKKGMQLLGCMGVCILSMFLAMFYLSHVLEQGKWSNLT